MTSKSDRQAARQVVAAYHEAQLGELVARAGDSIDGFRTGQLDAFDVDRILFQYSRASKELWKFATLADAEFAANLILERPPHRLVAARSPHEAMTSQARLLAPRVPVSPLPMSGKGSTGSEGDWSYPGADVGMTTCTSR